MLFNLFTLYSSVIINNFIFLDVFAVNYVPLIDSTFIEYYLWFSIIFWVIDDEIICRYLGMSFIIYLHMLLINYISTLLIKEALFSKLHLSISI